MINKMLKVSAVIKRLINSKAQTFIFTVYLNNTQMNEFFQGDYKNHRV